MRSSTVKIKSSRLALAGLMSLLLLALSGCPASNPTTPPPSSSPPGGLPSGGSPPGGLPSDGLPSGGPPGSPGSESSAGDSGSGAQTRAGKQSGSQGGGANGNVGQPPGSGGEGGSQTNRDGVANGGPGDRADVGMESGGAMPGSGADDLLDMSLEDFEQSMEDAAGDTAQTAPGADAAGQDGPPGEAPGDGAESAQTDYGGDSSTGVMTTAEQVAILDERLEESSGRFDDLILAERDVIGRTAKNREPAPDPGEEPRGYSDYGAAPPMRGSGGSGGGAGPIPRNQGPAGKFPTQAAVYPPPEDIPSGDDDDVVARQLREAAMRETDPRLREKLWDEYRKYKGIDR